MAASRGLVGVLGVRDVGGETGGVGSLVVAVGSSEAEVLAELGGEAWAAAECRQE